MLTMNNGMTHRAQDHKIFNAIIIPISVNMMDAKNFRHLIVSTCLAFFDKTLFNHFFSNSCIFRIPFFSFFFVNASLRTINPFTRFRIQKFLSTMFAFIFCVSSIYLRTMIAQSRAIFSFITSRRYMFKGRIANSAKRFNILSTSKLIFAFPRTIFESFKSTNRHVTFFITSCTIQDFTSSRFHYAAP